MVSANAVINEVPKDLTISGYAVVDVEDVRIFSTSDVITVTAVSLLQKLK